MLTELVKSLASLFHLSTTPVGGLGVDIYNPHVVRSRWGEGYRAVVEIKAKVTINEECVIHLVISQDGASIREQTFWRGDNGLIFGVARPRYGDDPYEITVAMWRSGRRGATVGLSEVSLLDGNYKLEVVVSAYDPVIGVFRLPPPRGRHSRSFDLMVAPSGLALIEGECCEH